MEISLAELRPLMYQGTNPNKQTLRDDSYLAPLSSEEHDPDVISERFHENSKFRRGTVRTVPGGDDGFLWQYVEANTTPDYPGNRLVRLPDTAPDSANLVDALEGRRSRGRYAESTLSIDRLSALLGRACGVTATAEADTGLSGDLSYSYRAYPSPGALYPIEIYPIVLDCDGLDEGVYYYLPEEHALRVLRTDDEDLSARVADLLTLSGETLDTEAANVLFVLTAAFWRVLPKYGARGYRYALQESGHVAQNIQLVAEALELNSVPVGGFYDDPLNAFLQLDGVTEAAVYTVPLGTRSPGGA